MNFIRFWFPVILYSGIIFYVSSINDLAAPPTIAFSDKLCHLIEYGLFGLLLARAVNNTKPGMDQWTLIVISLVGALLYGLSDEFHQSFVPGRSVELFDLLADALGGFLGGLTYTCIDNFKKKRTK
ncbi:MAG: VanZ family protein [Candidatus Omnitrophica bacterium]|nr:VanZ family protein [Candidatus Omnitrophota bacterium]